MVGIDKFDLAATEAHFNILAKTINCVPGKGFVPSNVSFIVKDSINNNLGAIGEIRFSRFL
jgi:hypothetical protein